MIMHYNEVVVCQSIFWLTLSLSGLANYLEILPWLIDHETLKAVLN